MGILIFTARVHDLAHQRIELEYKLSRITQKMQDLTKYSAIVGGGSISVFDLLSAPGSMMGRGFGYLTYADANAQQYVQQNAPAILQMTQNQSQTPEQQAQMQDYVIRQLYAQARDQAAKIEERNLNVEEGKLKAEKEKIETQLQEINTELQATKQARDAEIKEMAPRYVAQG